MPLFYLVFINFFHQVPSHTSTASNNEVFIQSEFSFDEAVKTALDAAQKNPTYQTYLNLGLVYYQSGEYEKSIEATQKAIDLDPNQAVAYNNIAAAYGALEKWEFEIAACEKALELDPDFILARNNLEWAKKQLNQSKEREKH